MVTTIASARASMPKYGFSPLPSQTQPPSGRDALRDQRGGGRVGAAGGRDDHADPVAPHHLGEFGGEFGRPGASSRKRPLLPPTRTATSGRGSVAKAVRQRSAASARRAGVTRCRAVRVTKTLGPVSSSWRAATTRSRSGRGSMRGCWTWPRQCRAGAVPRAIAAPTPPQAIARAGNGASHCVRNGGERHGQVEAASQRQGARRQNAAVRRLGRQLRPGRAPAPAARHRARLSTQAGGAVTRRGRWVCAFPCRPGCLRPCRRWRARGRWTGWWRPLPRWGRRA